MTTSGVTLQRDGDALLLSINGTSDSLRVDGYFYNDATYGYQVEQIRFADGTAWDIGVVKAKVQVATTNNDTLIGYATADTLSGLAGDDTIGGREGNDTLDGGAGEDRLYGEGGDDVLKGGTQNDMLDGGSGSDNLQGQDGDDSLYGREGNDTLEGGAGNDSLDGGYGNDTYLFGKGSGADTINSYEDTAGKLDTIQLGAGVTVSGVTLQRDGDALQLSINGTSDSLRVNGYFYNDATYGYQVEQIKFADGTTWDIGAVKAKVQVATANNDTLVGYAAADTLSGLAGDDTISARDGNDTLDGGAGEDRLYGEDGDDVLKGGTQSDYLDGGSGADNLQGQDGADSLYGRDGNDTLDGGAGNDWLDGGYGNDTYLFGKGSGADTISSYEDTAGKLDTIQLGAGVTASGVTLQRDGDALLLSINGTSDSLRVNGYFYNDATYGYQVEQIKFADGTTWDVAAVKSRAQAATAGNDTLIGYASAETLSGLAGDDSLSGRDGNDTLDGGAGEDRLYGEEGDDLLKGGSQNDFLDGGSGSDNLSGQDGDDSLYGREGNDTLEGGAGNDWLDGGYGNDTYLFGKGSGVDTINSYDDTTSKLDTIQLGAGVTTNGVTLRREGDALMLSINGTSDSIRVNGYFYDDVNSGYRVEQIKFADGTSWDVTAVKAKVQLGTTGNDTMIGYAAADTMSGLAGADTISGRDGDDALDGGAGEDRLYGEDGNDLLKGGSQSDYLDGGYGSDDLQGQDGEDTLVGRDGDDKLDGGSGNDWLDGGYGNDSYLFGKGAGSDTISEYDPSAAGSDSIKFGSGISADQLWFRQADGNLEIRIIGTEDKVTIRNWYAGDAYRIEQFQTSDGNVLMDSQVQGLVDAMASFSPPGAGQTTLPTSYEKSLGAAIAASWH